MITHAPSQHDRFASIVACWKSSDAGAAAMSRRDGKLPDRARLTYAETVNWIAFGVAISDDLTGSADFTEKWRRHPDPSRPPGLLKALRALAGGPPLWVPTTLGPDVPDFLAKEWKKKPQSFQELEAFAATLVDSIGRPAWALADEIEADYIAYAEKKKALSRAQQRISDAVAERRLAYADAPEAVGDYAEVDNAGWSEIMRAAGVEIPDSASGFIFGRPKEQKWFLKEQVTLLWPAEQASTAVGEPGKENARKRIDYRDRDAPLVEEMRRLIQSGRAKNPWDAARAVVHRAEGYGNEESKVKRLSGYFGRGRTQTAQS